MNAAKKCKKTFQFVEQVNHDSPTTGSKNQNEISKGNATYQM